MENERLSLDKADASSNNPFKYYGLYGWSDISENQRRSKIYRESLNIVEPKQLDPYNVSKEINYIHDTEVGKKIIEHVNNNIKNIHQPEIPSFLFIPYHENATSEDIKNVQLLIDTSFKDKTDVVPWVSLHYLKTMRNTGYNNQMSRQILEDHVKYAKEKQAEIPVIQESDDDETIKEKMFLLREIDKASKRTCDKIVLQSGKESDNTMYQEYLKTVTNSLIRQRISNIIKQESLNYSKITLEDVLIPDGERQLLLGYHAKTETYVNNPKLIKGPWPSFGNTKFGKVDWSQLLNKAVVDCFLDGEKSKDWLFPIRFILDSHPIVMELINKYNDLYNNKIHYLGFYIIKYTLDEKINKEYIERNKSDGHGCLKLFDDKYDRPHESKSNYYIFFVFKYGSSTDIRREYFQTNFRCNVVNWGEVADAKRIVYVESRQLMCMQTRTSDKIYGYVLSKRNDNQQNDNCINKMYGTLSEIQKCYQTIFHKEDAQRLLKDNWSLSTDTDSIHILYSKHNLRTIRDKLKDHKVTEHYNETKPNTYIPPHRRPIDYITIRTPDNSEYALIPCYFDWSNDFNSNPDTDRFLLRLGYLNEEKESYYHNKLCFKDDCILPRDEFRDLLILDKIGGGKADIQKLQKYIKMYLALKNDFENVNIPKNLKPMCKTTGHVHRALEKKTQSYDIHTKRTYENSKITNKVLSFIGSNTYLVLDIIKYVIMNKILIVSKNIFLAEACLSVFETINLTLVIIEPTQLTPFILLKEKYKERVTILYTGNTINIQTYKNIKRQIGTTQFNTIIIDTGRYMNDSSHISSSAIGLLLCYHNLDTYGSFIYYTSLKRNNSFGWFLLDMIYNSFYIQDYGSSHCLYLDNNFISDPEKVTMYLYPKKSNIDVNLLESFLNDVTYMDTKKYFTKEYPLSSEFIKFQTQEWKKIYKNAKNLLEAAQPNQKGGNVAYRRWSHFPYDNMPVETNDIQQNLLYKENIRDFQPKCHWGQKKLLLSEIQFLTKIYTNTKTLNNYIIVYIGSADGTHLPLLYQMFPQLTWLLYDPNPFNKMVYQKHVQVHNMYFTDDTIKHVLERTKNKKIIFISDIRVTTSEENVMMDMIKQAEWGVTLDAKFMLLKFRLPYTDKVDKVKHLELPKEKVTNYKKAGEKEMLYLKGKLFIQLYPPIHSTELRLMVEQDSDGKYPLKLYNYEDIEQKLFYYNTNIRGKWFTDEEKYNNVYLIPGFDNGIESISEYTIIADYLATVQNNTDLDEAVRMTYDLNVLLEKATGKSLLSCVKETYNKTMKKFPNQNIEKKRLELWQQISEVNKNNSLIIQEHLIKEKGKKVLGEKRVKEALDTIKKHRGDKLFMELKL
jgi:hypothetical protein